MQAMGKNTKVTVTTTALWLDGDTAYETGKYSYNFQQNGQPVTDQGRYVTIWKRQGDSSWKIAMDMGVPNE
jgi:ketosteroid isomerase-like protein